MNLWKIDLGAKNYLFTRTPSNVLWCGKPKQRFLRWLIRWHIPPTQPPAPPRCYRKTIMWHNVPTQNVANGNRLGRNNKDETEVWTVNWQSLVVFRLTSWYKIVCLIGIRESVKRLQWLLHKQHMNKHLSLMYMSLFFNVLSLYWHHRMFSSQHLRHEFATETRENLMNNKFEALLQMLMP